ncbi:MAG: hypothetical protein HYR66_03605 [Sphingobacteriales bacterium]|nr:hypothetical protein [Sphingobacteriales bacterium]
MNNKFSMQKVRSLIFLIPAVLLVYSFSKTPPKSKLKWMTLAEAQAAMKTNPKPLAGYMKPSELEPIAKYFGEGNFGKQTFETFRQKFKPEW